MFYRRAEGITTANQTDFNANSLRCANNTAKVIKRAGYGFQDLDCFSFKLKRRAFFPTSDSSRLTGLQPVDLLCSVDFQRFKLQSDKERNDAL